MEYPPDLTSQPTISSLIASIALERLSIVEAVHAETEKLYSKTDAVVSGAPYSEKVEDLLQLNDHLDVIMKAVISKEIYIEGIMEIIDKIVEKSAAR
ncbi:hypothetical protein [Paenibacillus senegalensis]|uniref:hypothetical protein n=1 Tax=Paenibacillus senegalensis TaxID=1465766 RepID=UPI000287F851|nr:hypothetical protein [Paenibacillus senegalensis]